MTAAPDPAAVRAVLRTRVLYWRSGPSVRGRRWALRLLWEPRDLWIGLYWKHDRVRVGQGRAGGKTDLYLCLLPCLPLRLTVYSEDWMTW